ncbi:MAG: NUDIX domain-containing protein [Bacteroidia bacterium]|nr:NUDIX domain-containing protein [Bacteroidia bacterium]
MPHRFNIRVYGILIHEGALLVSDEYIKRNKITKLPGGGLEFGEGTRDCLKREFKEELGLEVEVTDHFYTTDFYVASSFSTNSQVLSIYYLVKPLSELNFKVSQTPHNYEKKEGAQAMRWLKLQELKENDFTLIIDRKVAEMLIKTQGKQN